MLKSLGKVTIASAGTPERITKDQSTPATNISSHAVLIEALSANTGKIYIGTSTLNKTTLAGVLAVLAVPTTNIIPVFSLGVSIAPNGINLADIYFDCDTTSEGVTVGYIQI